MNLNNIKMYKSQTNNAKWVVVVPAEGYDSNRLEVTGWRIILADDNNGQLQNFRRGGGGVGIGRA